MKRETLIFRAASTFMLFLLTSCGSPPSTGPADTIRKGQIDEATSLIYKCRAIREWIEPFETQFPSLDLGSIPASEYPDLPQIGMLFNRNRFVPVFGFEYTAANAEKLSDTKRGIIAACREPEKSDRYEAEFFRDHQKFFAQAFERFDPIIEKHAHKNFLNSIWVHSALSQLDTLPLDKAGLQKLDVEIAAPARTVLSSLPQREQQEFMGKLAAKRNEITDRIAAAEGSLASLPPVSAPQQSAPLPPPVLTLEDSIAEKLRELESISLTLDGRQQSVAWITGFERDFSAYNGNDQVIKARWAWILKREKIFKATKNDFIARLAKLPTGPGSETAHSQLLIETFPLRTDETMAVYKEYRAEILSRQKPFFRRTFEQGLDKLLSVREWLSEAARKTVHGSVQKDSR